MEPEEAAELPMNRMSVENSTALQLISILLGSLFLLSCDPNIPPDKSDAIPIQQISKHTTKPIRDSEAPVYCPEWFETGAQSGVSLKTDDPCRPAKILTHVIRLTAQSARYQITFDAMWTATDFPTNFPGNAHFSPIVGTAHNQQVVFWEVDGQPATIGIESMAESGSTSAISSEITAAQISGYSLGISQGSGIGSGDGDISVEFDVSTNYPLISFVSMVAPSPDWFVGISGFSLLDGEGNWKVHEEISLRVYDAGTDLGLRPTSANQDNSADNLPITLLSSDRADTDFENGVHFQSSKVIGKFIIDKL